MINETNRPPIGVMLLTFDRFEYASATLRAFQKWAEYSGPLVLCIADDGSSEGYREALRAIAFETPCFDEVRITNGERGGYGHSYNLATQALHEDCPVLLPIEDDWELTRTLDLDRYVDALSEGVRCIRLGYLGFTQALRGELKFYAGQMFLELEPSSSERHVCAGHPRLETRAFERAVGPWAEGLMAGATEFEWCGRESARRGVAWPMELAPWGDLFVHIGTLRARED